MKRGDLKQGVMQALSAVGILLMVSCAGTKLTSMWVGRDYRGGAFERILVVVLSEDYDRRKAFETDFVTGLKEKGVAGLSAAEAMAPNRELSREAVKGA